VSQGVFGDDELLQFCFERVGLGLGGADDRDQAGQDLYLLWVAGLFSGAVLEVGVELLRIGQGGRNGRAGAIPSEDSIDRDPRLRVKLP